MSSSNPSGGARANGKGSERKKNKRRFSNRDRCRHPAARRTTETAPHILAALEAQRARASQQAVPPPQHQTLPAPPADAPRAPRTQPPQAPPPPPPALPGYVFDPARNRFFRAVKDSLGTPGPIARNVGGSGRGATMRRKLKIPIVLGRSEASRMPPPSPPRTGEGTRSWGTTNAARGNGAIANTTSGGGSSSGSSSSSSRARVAGVRSAPSFANGAPARDTMESERSGGVSVGKGLHSHAMNSRRGFWSRDTRTRRSRAVPAGSERARRAEVESVVSSSRFRLRSLPLWAHMAPGAAYSAIDWNAGRGVLAVGTNSGALGMMTMRKQTMIGGGESGYGGDSGRCRCADDGGGGSGSGIGGSGGRQRERADSRRDGFRGEGEEAERVCWGSAASRSSSQVSDIKFREQGDRWACATASLGCGGEPGGVNIRFWREEMQGESRDAMDVFSNARGCETKLRKGSVWCTEWDPLTPTRLAVGPSSCSPLAFFDFEKQRLIPVAKLSSDVFSMSFLPPPAPGAGHAFVCGLRDGSVVLVDPRQPPRQNGTTTLATSLTGGRGPTTSSGGGGGGGGGTSHASGGHGPRRGPIVPPSNSAGGATAVAAQSLLLRLDCSSVDHTHILRDGTRCLVKDRSGGLQAVDLRFCGEQGQGSGEGSGRGHHRRGRAPQLKVLVAPCAPGTMRRSKVPGRFALDPAETFVVTPVAAAARVGGGSVGGGGGGGTAGVAGGGEHFPSSSRAWDAFASCSSGLRHHEAVSANGMNGSGRVNLDSSFFVGSAASGDRIRILNVSSGEVLNDFLTPWTGVSLARGAAATLAGAGGADPCRCHSGHMMRFWGSAWEAGRGAAVFEARLGAEAAGGYGR